MADPADIDAVELVSVWLLADGRRVRLRVRDQNGRTRAVDLDSQWLNAMVTALPWPSFGAEAQPLDGWNMEPTSEGVLLTLRTAEGKAMTFLMKPWQVEGMATIATYGNVTRVSKPMMH